MGLVDRWKKRSTTRKHAALLARISNGNQRRALTAALEAEAVIPDSAWAPLPENLRVEFTKTDAQLAMAQLAMAQRFVEEIVRAAEKARVSTSDADYLCAPLGDCDTIEVASQFTPLANLFTPLCTWGVCNPFSPSTATLILVEVPETLERLLFLRVKHPSALSAVVHGVLPKSVSEDSKQLNATLQRLFQRNGSPDYPLMSSLPTHVVLMRHSAIPRDDLKELFFLAAPSASGGADIEGICERMENFKGDLWARATAELKAGLKTFTKTGRVTPTRAQLERWWALVTDPQHVQSETSQMQKAWSSATEFLKRKSSEAKS